LGLSKPSSSRGFASSSGKGNDDEKPSSQKKNVQTKYASAAKQAATRTANLAESKNTNPTVATTSAVKPENAISASETSNEVTSTPEEESQNKFTGTERIYPLYDTPNELFDTYTKATHNRTPKKDSRGNPQEYTVSTTLINDPPLFMINPHMRPTPRFPTRKYIGKKFRTTYEEEQEQAGKKLKKADEEKENAEGMAQMDREELARGPQSSASRWGANLDHDLVPSRTRPGTGIGTGTAGGQQDPRYENQLDKELDHLGWNNSDLYNDFRQWDRQATPRADTSFLPNPSDAQSILFAPAFLSTLMRFPLVTKRVVQQTGKGRAASFYVLTVAGNGDGLVGFGEGKDVETARAIEKSFVAACKDLDYVERFEGRTIWNDIETKWGGTRVILRPRPMGFGLRCNPYIHQVFISFISSTNFSSTYYLTFSVDL
jgi:hypothetical protein